MEKKNNKRPNFFALLALGVVVIWAGSAFLIFHYLDTWEHRGTFGDLFGAVNALFSGLAFAGLLYTINLQKREIAQNRVELRKSAKAQQKSEEALSEQVVQMKLNARLNALKTLIDYYSAQINNPSNTPELIEKARSKRKEAVLEIDTLIDRIGDDELE